MKFEKQLAHIKNKAELHEEIDKLPEDFEGVLVLRYRGEVEPEMVSYKVIGEISADGQVRLAFSLMQYLTMVGSTDE